MLGAIVILGMVYGLFQWLDNNWITDAGVNKGKAAIQADWDAAKAKQRQDEADKADKAAKKKGDGDAKAKVVYRTITQNVDRYIDRPIYRAECFDVDGMRDANSALGGKIAAPAGTDKPMPRPDAAK